MEAKLRDLIIEADNKIELYKAPRQAIADTFKNPCSGGNCNRNLNVAVVAAPCHGFGDVIFATKFARYLKYGLTKGSKPYSNQVSIITPAAEMFKKLGVNDLKLVPLKGGAMQCRRLRAYDRPAGVKKLDLIFIAPLMADFEINYADVKALFKESTPFNTIFLSEYQDSLKKGFDIPTGVGKDYRGLLFDGQKPSPKLKAVGSVPYALAYLAKDVGLPTCLNNFVKMVVVKYHKRYPNLQIVLPDWGVEKLAKTVAFRKFMQKYYPNLVLKTKTDTIQLTKGEKRGTLILRGDILPVPRPDMLSLMKHSIADILVTGDQSLTDVVDCCQRKNIWYQTVPWKINFAKALSKEMPQKFLGKITTSCGTLKAIKWNNKATNFKSRHDFRKKAKHDLDAIFRSATFARCPGSVTYRYLAQLEKSRSKAALLHVVE